MLLVFGGRRIPCAFALTGLLHAAASPAPPTSQGNAVALRLIQTIPMPGVEGRIDHLALDLDARRLFICALGNGTVEVVDLEKGQRVQSLAGFEEPQGIVFMPKTGTVVVASGGGQLAFLEGSPLKVTRTLALGEDADNVRYDGEDERIYVGYGGGALAEVDALKRERVGDVPLEGHPESFQRESSGRIFVNEARRARVAVLDVAKRSVISRWELGGPRANYPMALDEAKDRLFVGTRQPARLVVLDTNTGKVVATLETETDVDDIFHDAARRRVYVIGGGGSVVVYDQAGPDQYAERARVRTADGARTGLFSPESGRLYVAVPRRGSPVAEIRVFAAVP
jgi:DNA-binding beta-propeller fold protein YncE